jgi:glutathione S-transferase
VRKVLWTCEELGLPFEREDRDTRSLNPVHMVPVIDDGAFQDPVAIQAAIELLNRMIGIIDTQLGRTGAYIAGERFTMADIVIGLSLQRWHSIPMQRPHYPNVERYFERLLERVGLQRYGREGGP